MKKSNKKILGLILLAIGILLFAKRGAAQQTMPGGPEPVYDPETATAGRGDASGSGSGKGSGAVNNPYLATSGRDGATQYKPRFNGSGIKPIFKPGTGTTVGRG